MSTKKSYTYQLKVVLVGDGSVGKTSLFDRHVKELFNERYKMTVRPNSAGLNIQVLNDVVKLSIWDYPGQDRFRFLFDDMTLTKQKKIKGYCSGANAAILVSDLTNYESFNNLGNWENILLNTAGLSTEKIIYVGNKCDLVDEIKVENNSFYDRVKSKNGLAGIITSAKSGDNVEEAFKLLTHNAVYNLKVGLVEKGIMKISELDTEEYFAEIESITENMKYGAYLTENLYTPTTA